MCINYCGTCFLPPSLNKQVAVYKFSICNWLFERGCLSILVAIKTGCTDGAYILEMQQYPPLRPLQLNFLFLGLDQPIKFVNEMFLFILKITCSIM